MQFQGWSITIERTRVLTNIDASLVGNFPAAIITIADRISDKDTKRIIAYCQDILAKSDNRPIVLIKLSDL